MIIKKQFLPFVILLLSFFLPSEKIKINNSVLEVVIADTKQSRNQGLMFIDSLDENMGMFFIWSESSKKCMWMRNTKIPLSVAFIDENFLITPESKALNSLKDQLMENFYRLKAVSYTHLTLPTTPYV